MLGTEIAKQGQLFLEAVLLGALLMLLYDLLRILRRIFRHGVFAVAVGDLLYWLFWAFGIFGFMYRENDGVIRVFLILGAVAGMAFYGVFASRHVVRAGTACLRRVLRILRHAFLVAGAPARRFGRMLCGRMGRCRLAVTRFFRRKANGRKQKNENSMKKSRKYFEKSKKTIEKTK